MCRPHAYLRKATDRKERDRTSLPTASVWTQGSECGWRTDTVFQNVKHRPWLTFRAQPKPLESKHCTGCACIWYRWMSLVSMGAREKKHLSRGSRVKTYFDICFRGHSIPARINVLPPFNFTWAWAKSQHCRRIITLLCLDQLVTGLWTPQKSAQGNYSPISLQIPLGHSTMAWPVLRKQLVCIVHGCHNREPS